MDKNKQVTDEDYVKLGKAVEGVLLGDYFHVNMSKKRLVWINFLKGVASGFGGILGATILVALLLWLLSLFNQFPFVNHISDSIRSAVNAHTSR